MANNDALPLEYASPIMLINSVKACRVILVSMECEYTSEKQYTDRQTDGRNEHDKQTTIKHYEHTFSVCWRGFQNMTTRRPNSGRRVVFVPKGACLRLCLLNVIITINNTPDNVEVHTHSLRLNSWRRDKRRKVYIIS